MKAGKEHKIPLLEILFKLPRNGDHVFPLSNMAMLQLLRGMQPGLTVHGFRSCFMDWAHETTNHPKITIDMALAHKVGDKVEAAYRRGNLFVKRTKLMSTWGEFCGKTPISPTVISFRKTS